MNRTRPVTLPPPPASRDDSADFHIILAVLVGALIAIEAAVMLGILP